MLKRFINLRCWQNIRNSKILITGGTGFIGFYIVCILIRMNDKLKLKNEIIIHGRKISKLKELYGTILNRKDVKCYVSNIVEEQVFGGEFDYIIHAAMPSDALKTLDPVSVMDIAIKGTENIVALAICKNVKSFVYLSSVTIYGDLSCKKNIGEDYFDKQDWRNDNDAYMLGKRCAEFVLFSKHKNKGLPVKIIRPGYVYGANPLSDGRVYNDFIASIAKGDDIELKSNGSLKRPLVYVLEVVKAVLLALDSNKNGEAFNISGDAISLRNFYEILVQRENDLTFSAQSVTTSSGNDCIVNTQKSRQLLGMEYEASHENLIKEAIVIKKRMIDYELHR